MSDYGHDEAMRDLNATWIAIDRVSPATKAARVAAYVEWLEADLIAIADAAKVRKTDYCADDVLDRVRAVIDKAMSPNRGEQNE